MTLHIHAPQDVTDEMREEARAAGVDLDYAIEQMHHLFDSIGDPDYKAHIVLERAETEGGELLEQVRFGITGRYIKDGIKYVVGDGFVLNFTSLLSLFEKLGSE